MSDGRGAEDSGPSLPTDGRLDGVFDAVDPGDGATPEGVDPPTFAAPWQARAFALAVALHDGDDRDLRAFQERFIDRLGAVDPEALQADVEGTYYERWLATLEAFLVDEGLVDEGELDARASEFTEGERDASEFVVDEQG